MIGLLVKKPFWLFFLLILLIGVVVFFPFLKGDYLLLYNDIALDSYMTFYTRSVLAWRYLSRGHIPTWSFQDGLGGDVFAESSFFPFYYAVVLLGPEGIIRGLPFLALALVISIGGCFYYYLGLMGVGVLGRAVGATMFAFNGFFLINLTMSPHLAGNCLIFVLVLISVELIFRRKIFSGVLISIFVSMMACFVSPAYLYLWGLIVILYLGGRSIGERMKLKAVIKKILRGALLWGAGAITGAIMVAPVVIGGIITVLESIRAPVEITSPEILLKGGQERWFDIVYSALTRMYAPTLRGFFLPKDKGVRGIWEEYNLYEAPCLYITIGGLIMGYGMVVGAPPQWRRRLLPFFLISVAFIVFPFLQLAAWGFYEFYFRELNYWFAFSLVLHASAGVTLLAEKDKVKRAATIFLFTAILLLLLLPVLKSLPEKKKVYMDSRVFGMVLFFLIAYGVILLIARGGAFKIGLVAFLVLLGVEVIVVARNTLIRHYVEIKAVKDKKQIVEVPYSESLPNCSFVDPERTEPCARGTFRGRDLQDALIFDADFKKCVDSLKKIERSPFFRIANYKRMYFNENKIMDYYTTTTYRYANSKYLVRYLLGFGYMDSIELTSAYRARWIRGFIRRNWMGEILNNVYYNIITRYAFERHKNSIMNTYDPVMKAGDVVVMRHRFRLPFGYTYTSYVTEEEIRRLGYVQKDIIATRAVILSPEVARKIGNQLFHFSLPPDSILKKLQYDLNIIVPALNALAARHLQIEHFSDTMIKGSISVDRNSVMYLSFPYSPWWRVWIDGKEDTLLVVNMGMSGIFIPKGKHEIVLRYDPPYLKYGLPLAAGGWSIFLCWTAIALLRKRAPSPKNT